MQFLQTKSDKECAHSFQNHKPVWWKLSPKTRIKKMNEKALEVTLLGMRARIHNKFHQESWKITMQE